MRTMTTMMTTILLLLLPALAVTAGTLLPAWPSTSIQLPEQRDLFYCQGFDTGAWPVPANSVDELEVADDVPADLRGLAFDEIGFYCSVYVLGVGAGFEDFDPPEAVTFNIYSGTCPPGMEPVASYTFPWESLETELTDQTSQYCIWWVEAQLPELQVIGEGTSLGWICHTERSIEEDPPVLVGPMGSYEIFGECGGWIDAHLFDLPRWSELDFAWGEPMDLMYCLGIKATPTAISNWTGLKARY